ncbi:hypothetical protein [Frigoribacterium sp. CG_9.8]|uniref:hypothetical protein n=1 Tax=Frigoribacterium sp. CG_9.8 TaxID=2787733 RepID=UPI0018CBEBA2|nr:hypothetical protein [Frigoribacterium sp. CG_9.8]MBG6106582.1 hypothetical protein [Frigoribacterium sp. CG_9.8]
MSTFPLDSLTATEHKALRNEDRDSHPFGPILAPYTGSAAVRHLAIAPTLTDRRRRIRARNLRDAAQIGALIVLGITAMVICRWAIIIIDAIAHTPLFPGN